MIRKMVEADIYDVISLVKANWPGEKRIEQSIPLELADMFSTATYRPTFFVAEEEGVIVGVGAWNWAWHNYDIYEMFWGNVLASHRGRGIGRQLVETRLKDIKIVSEYEIDQRRSYVTVSTHHVKMYERYGFKTLTVMDLWQSPATHLMMRSL